MRAGVKKKGLSNAFQCLPLVLLNASWHFSYGDRSFQPTFVCSSNALYVIVISLLAVSFDKQLHLFILSLSKSLRIVITKSCLVMNSVLHGIGRAICDKLSPRRWVAPACSTRGPCSAPCTPLTQALVRWTPPESWSRQEKKKIKIDLKPSPILQSDRFPNMFYWVTAEAFVLHSVPRTAWVGGWDGRSGREGRALLF